MNAKDSENIKDGKEEFTQLPPTKQKGIRDYEAEEWVLACMLDDVSCLTRAIEFLTPNDFEDGSHQKIFEACLTLTKENIPVDLSTVEQRLGPEETRISYLIKDYYPTTETFEYWKRHVKKASLERRLRDEIKEIDIDLERIDSIMGDIMRVNQVAPLYRPISEVPDLREDPATLIKTGLPDVDYWLRFRPGNLMVIAGRKGEGKTSFGLGALHYMSQEYPVGVISIEMTAQEIKARIKQAFGGLIPDKNFFIADPPFLSTAGLRHLCKRLRDREGIRLVMVDYLQLMRETSRFQSRHLEVSHIIRRIKEIAKELDIGMIVISTLSRGADDNSWPSSSHLKESGDIEYAADLILFIHSLQKGDKDFVSENVKVLVLDKNRFGVGNVRIKVYWLGKLTRFATYDAAHDEVNGRSRAYAD